MTTDTIYTALAESTENGVENIDPARVGKLRGRSELVAEAARHLAGATGLNTTYGEYDEATDSEPVTIDEHALDGEAFDAKRAHAAVLLQMDQAESLAALAEDAMRAGARDALIGESLIGAVETAGQDTTAALGEIAAQLAKLNDTLDAHRCAVIDTAGDVRAEVELLGEDLRGIDRTLECALDEVRDLRISVEEQDNRFSYPEASWFAARTGVFFLIVAAAADRYGASWDIPSGAAKAVAVYGGLIAVLAIVLAIVPAVVARWNLRKAVTSANATALVAGEPYVEPDFTDDTVRSAWIARAIAGDEEAQFDIEVALIQAGYPLDLAERRAELAADTND